MSDYRVYIVGDHGHFINAVEIECADDAEAAVKAQQLVDGHDVQLWQRGRRVGEIRRDNDPALKT